MSREAILVAERFADGAATLDELSAAWDKAATLAPQADIASECAANAAVCSADADAIAAATQATVEVRAAAYAAFEAKVISSTQYVNETEAHIPFLHDIFGNPFRPPPVIDPGWLAWNDTRVRSIAQAIYDERAFINLPILADALEDAGCDNPDILNHCRGPGPHVRGCWVVDLLLGKE
jgi:hypothetical protein